MYQSIPKPPILPPGNPRAFDSRWAPYSGEFDPKWGPPGGAFDFRVKTPVGGRKQKDRDFAIEFFDSACETRSRVIALVDSTWAFLLLSFYVVISWIMPLFKVWSEDKLNKKFLATENFAELVSTVALTCLEDGGFDRKLAT